MPNDQMHSSRSLSQQTADGKSFFLFEPTNVPIPLVEKLTKMSVSQLSVKMITYRQLNRKAKTRSPISIGADKYYKQIIQSTLHLAHT